MASSIHLKGLRCNYSLMTLYLNPLAEGIWVQLCWRKDVFLPLLSPSHLKRPKTGFNHLTSAKVPFSPWISTEGITWAAG